MERTMADEISYFDVAAFLAEIEPEKILAMYGAAERC